LRSRRRRIKEIRRTKGKERKRNEPFQSEGGVAIRTLNSTIRLFKLKNNKIERLNILNHQAHFFLFKRNMPPIKHRAPREISISATKNTKTGVFGPKIMLDIRYSIYPPVIISNQAAIFVFIGRKTFSIYLKFFHNFQIFSDTYS
jgi:hypothetical protein